MPACPRPDLKRHETYVDYQRGCRCPAARHDSRRYTKALRCGLNQPRRINPTGARRRLTALAALGWRMSDIADATGLTEQALQRVHSGRNSWIYRTTADAITAAYDKLSMTLGPSEQTRKYAKLQGWLPPLAWDDDDIDQPDAKPHRARTLAPIADMDAVEDCAAGRLHASKLDAAGRRAVVERLNHLTAARIAEITGMSTRTVDRARTSIARTKHTSAA